MQQRCTRKHGLTRDKDGQLCHGSRNSQIGKKHQEVDEYRKKTHKIQGLERWGTALGISFPTSHILTIAAPFSVVVAASLLSTGDTDALLCPLSTTHSFCPSTPSLILLLSSATSKSSYCFKPRLLLTAGSLPCGESIMLSENLPLSPPDSLLGLSPLPGPTLAKTARRHQPQAGLSDWERALGVTAVQ